MYSGVAIKCIRLSDCIVISDLSVYRPLSEFKNTQEITAIVKHDMSFAVCLFLVANGALFVQILEFTVRVRGLVGLAYRVRDKVRV